MLRFYLIIFTFLAVCGCNNPKQDRTGKEIVLNLSDPGNSELTTSDIFSDLVYVPLETREGSYISKVSQYIISEKYIIILDRDQGKVLLFSGTGAFLRNISARGKGPGEYLEVRNISFFEEEEIICLTDIQSKVDFYNTSGEFLSSIPYSPGAYWVEAVKDKIFCFYPFPVNKINEDYQISIFDKYGRFIKKSLNRYEGLGYPGSPMANPKIVSSHNEILFWEEYSDSVYSINKNGEFEVKYWFRYSNQQPAHKKIQEIGADPDSWKRGMHISNFTEAGNYLFIESVSDGLFNYLIYNRMTGTSRKIKMINNKYGLAETLDGGITFWPDYSINGIVSMVAMPDEIINHFKDTADKEMLNDIFIELAHSIQLNSNPILIMGILKN